MGEKDHRILRDSERKALGIDQPDESFQSLKEETKKDYQRNARRHIREAFLEFREIWQHMTRDDRRHIFEPNEQSGGKSKTSADEIEAGARDIIKFIYAGLAETKSEEKAKDLFKEEIGIGREIGMAELRRKFHNLGLLNEVDRQIEQADSVIDLAELPPASEDLHRSASLIGYRNLGIPNQPPHLKGTDTNTLWTEADKSVSSLRDSYTIDREIEHRD